MSTALQILYHDKKVIPYRRELRPLLGSVNATILFQEAVYLHGLKNRSSDVIHPFYMFRIPAPNHKHYEPGQSWVELLGFSPREFDSAIKKVAVKISVRKNDVLEVMAEALINANPRGLVVYWTNADRVTYYLLNVPLAEMVIEFCYSVFKPESDWVWEDAKRQFQKFVAVELARPNRQKRNYVIAEIGDPNQQKRNYVIAESAITYSRFPQLVINKEEQKDKQKDKQKDNKQQQEFALNQDELIAEIVDDEPIVAVAAEKRFSIWDAFRLAGIKKHTARRIPEAWKKATGEDITVEDILAWHFYREAENLNLPAGRQLRPAYVISNLEKGDRAEKEFYDQAREYLAELTTGGEEDAPEPIAPGILDLHRALEAYLPPIWEIGPEALDAQHSGLPDISSDLHACDVNAKIVADLHLYLTYTEQAIPQPEGVAEALAQAGPEFNAWRERKAEAERLWQRILQQGGLAAPGSAIDQAMRQATPVDLNGALVVMADSSLEWHFTRLWPRKSATVLSGVDYPENLPIQFLSI